jgi:hypothetical protein
MTPPLAPIEGKRVVKVHVPVFPGHRGRRLLCFCLFHHEICQCLGLDCRLRAISYVKTHELESQLGNPSRGEAVPD